MTTPAGSTRRAATPGALLPAVLTLALGCSGSSGSSTPPPPNHAPSITSAAPTSARQGHPYSYAVTTSDPDADAVTLALAAGPAGASVVGSTLAWTPTAAQVGASQSFRLAASDARGGVAEQTWQVTPAANAPPAFVTSPPASAAWGTPWGYAAGAIDADGDPVSYTLTSAPLGATLLGSSINWDIQPSQSRFPGAFVLQASDGFGGVATQSWSLTPTGPIQLSRVLTWVQDGTVTDVPADMTGYVGTSVLQALVPDGAGGFNVIANFTAGSPGTGQLTGVDPGSYWLRFGPASYIWTTSSVIDLGYDTYARPDRQPAAITPTNLTFNVTGLGPWASVDDLQLTISNAGFWNTLFDPRFPLANAPAIGDTALVLTTIDWWKHDLISGSKGDSVYLTQLEPIMVGGQQVPVITRSLGPLQLEQVDGTALAVSGAFSVVPQTGRFRLNWALDQFMQYQAQVSASATASTQDLALDVHPGGTGRGWIIASPDLVWYRPPTLGATPITLGDVAYGNPYPAGWEPFVISRITFRRGYLAPGAATPAFATGTLETDTPVLPTATSPVVPLVSPPRNLTVKPNGSTVALDATLDQAGVGLTPTLGWSAPGLGTPTGFHVFVYGLGLSGAATTITRIADLQCKTNGLQVPPGVLQVGGSYAFMVRAQVTPGVDFATAPYRKGLPTAWPTRSPAC